MSSVPREKDENAAVGAAAQGQRAPPVGVVPTTTRPYEYDDNDGGGRGHNNTKLIETVSINKYIY